MLRFSVILVLTALNLTGMEMVSARRTPPQRRYGSGDLAQMACRQWQSGEGSFTIDVPGARLLGQSDTIRTLIRGCEADLDHPVVLGYRYNVVADAHYDAPLAGLHHQVIRRFPFPPEPTGRERNQSLEP